MAYYKNYQPLGVCFAVVYRKGRWKMPKRIFIAFISTLFPSEFCAICSGDKEMDLEWCNGEKSRASWPILCVARATTTKKLKRNFSYCYECSFTLPYRGVRLKRDTSLSAKVLLRKRPTYSP